MNFDQLAAEYSNMIHSIIYKMEIVKRVNKRAKMDGSMLLS
ncbi:hypothetical protein [Bacillus sp. V3B]|nr:hypothetical protein [Bacillus sp. V3B]